MYQSSNDQFISHILYLCTMKTLIVIPARYASSRFPGKPLALINGQPMIQWVYERVRLSSADAVVVATDDERIAQTVMDFKGQVALTAEDHKNGTSRCREVALLFREYDLVINVQGDEPLIDPGCLDEMITALKEGNAIVSLYHDLPSDQAADPHKVKVVLDASGRALYFSRSMIPYTQGKEEVRYRQHVGVYGFHRDTLLELGELPVGSLATAESLEQLTWLEQGHTIKMIPTDQFHFGVDTPEDLREIETYIKKEDIRLGKPGR